MNRYATGLFLGLLVLVSLFAGCSRNEAAPVAETADQAVLQVTEGLADGQPQVLWHALPTSYQQDVTDLIHEFGDKMDAELWNRSFGVVQKITLDKYSAWVQRDRTIGGVQRGDAPLVGVWGETPVSYAGRRVGTKAASRHAAC